MRRGLIALVVGCALACATIGRAAQVTATKVGSPTWNLADFNLDSANVGTAQSGYQEFFDLTGGQILTAPFYKNYPGVGAGPSGVAHPPPYDKDLSNGLANLNLQDKSTFSVPEFSNGKGVLLSFMVIADGSTTGTSPDGADLPIIPNSLFPIQVHRQTHRNGANFDAASDFPVPAQTGLDPAFANVEGATHFPFFFFDNGDFADDKNAPLTGNYDFDATLTDTSGAGWHVVAPFTVESGGPTAIPLPAAIYPGFMLLAGLPVLRRLRRR
jgi:hypothetical protein